MSDSFPFLSQIAQYFDEYEFHQLIFEVKSMVHDGSESAMGNVIVATQYNPTSGPFSNKIQMENYEYANSHKIADSSHHGVECDPLKKGGSATEYVRTGAIPPNTDIKSYDLGIFNLCTSGVPAGYNIGELWVDYTVKLSKARIGFQGEYNMSQAPISNWGLVNQSVPTGNTPFVPSSLSTSYETLQQLMERIGSEEVIISDNIGMLVKRSGTLTGSAKVHIKFPASINGGRFMILISRTLTSNTTFTSGTLVSSFINCVPQETTQSGPTTWTQNDVNVQVIVVDVTADDPSLEAEVAVEEGFWTVLAGQIVDFKYAVIALNANVDPIDL